MDTPAQRLKWARETNSSYSTASDAARAYGWTVPTYLGHENGDRNPSREAAKRYAVAYKVPWDWLLEGGPVPNSKAGKARRIAAIPTRGEVAAGQWLDLDVAIDAKDFDQYPIAVDPRYPAEAQYGLIVRGTSINRVANPGDVLHCLDTGIAPIDPDDDDLVIVERRRAQQGQREVTAKRIRRRGSIVFLMPDSTDKKWKPLDLDTSNSSDEEEIAVIALVLAIYKPLRNKR